MTEGTHTVHEPESLVETAKPLTRRQLLRAAAIGGVALVGGTALAACGGSATTTTVNVTFLTGGWPDDAMPTAAQQKSSINSKAYADALEQWLKQHPGVKIKHTDVNIWSQQAITSSISAGTAPTWFMGSILGSFINNVVFSGFARGLAADVTNLVESTHLLDQLDPGYIPNYNYWKVNGKYFGTPGGYGISNGIFFRRDLIQQAGLEEPTPDWTWTDFRTMAKELQAANPKMKGAALQNYIFDTSFTSNGLNAGATGYGLLGLDPAPSNAWPWRYNLTPYLSQYQQMVDNWRGMYYTDKTLTSSTSTGDSDVAQAFARGDVALIADNGSYFQRALSDPTNVANIAIKLGKSFDDVVGWVSQPVGELGSFGGSQANGVVCSFDPHLQRNQPALAAAFDFGVQMLIGQALVNQRQEIYKSTKDLKTVFLEIPPMSKLQVDYGLSGKTAAEAWGPKIIASYSAAAKIPLVPDPALYFPAEGSAGPTGDAWNDANSGMAYTQDAVPGLLNKLQSVSNTQFSGLSSSVSKSTFIASAKKFFADSDSFWHKYAPRFSSELYHQWYEQTVLPALNG